MTDRELPIPQLFWIGQWDELADVADHLVELSVVGVGVQQTADTDEWISGVLLRGGTTWLLAPRPGATEATAAATSLLRGLVGARLATIASHPPLPTTMRAMKARDSVVDALRRSAPRRLLS